MSIVRLTLPLRRSEVAHAMFNSYSGEFEFCWPTSHDAKPFFMRTQAIMRLHPTAPLRVVTDQECEWQAPSVWDIPPLPLQVRTTEEIGLNAAWQDTSLGCATASLQGWERLDTGRLLVLMQETGTLALQANVQHVIEEVRELIGGYN